MRQPIPTPAAPEANDALCCATCDRVIATAELFARPCAHCHEPMHQDCWEVSLHTSGNLYLCWYCWREDVPFCSVCSTVPDGDAILTTCHRCTAWLCGDCMVAVAEYDYCPDCAWLEGIYGRP